MGLIRPGLRRRDALALPLAAWLPFRPAARLEAAENPRSRNYEVKATYLLKFPAFVTWNGALPPDAFNICVVGDDPFSGLLRKTAAGQRVEQRPVVVNVLPYANRSSNCQVMYVAGSAAQPVASALAAVRGMHVLTVTDGQRDPASKGVINFVTEQDRVRFEIDLAAARAHGLTISSKLLNIALNFRGGKRQ